MYDQREGYVLVTRVTHSGGVSRTLEPAKGFPEELAIVGTSISEEDAIRVFGLDVTKTDPFEAIQAAMWLNQQLLAKNEECRSCQVCGGCSERFHKCIHCRCLKSGQALKSTKSFDS